jgi:hypothetical protein
MYSWLDSLLAVATVSQLRMHLLCTIAPVCGCDLFCFLFRIVGDCSSCHHTTCECMHACRIVIYVPNCSDITHHTMSYSQNKQTGMWDTREPAQVILRSVLEAHGNQLKELPQKLEGGSGTLYDLCNLGDSASDVRIPYLTIPWALPDTCSTRHGSA